MIANTGKPHGIKDRQWKSPKKVRGKDKPTTVRRDFLLEHPKKRNTKCKHANINMWKVFKNSMENVIPESEGAL